MTDYHGTDRARRRRRERAMTRRKKRTPRVKPRCTICGKKHDTWRDYARKAHRPPPLSAMAQARQMVERFPGVIVGPSHLIGSIKYRLAQQIARALRRARRGG
jgi:hypothetical protein